MTRTNSIQAVLALAWKDLQVIFHDRGLLMVIIGLPMIFSMLNGVLNERAASAGEGGMALPVAVVNQDAGDYGRQVVDILEGIDVLEISRLDSPAEAEQRVLDTQVLAAILIPANLTQHLNDYLPSEIEVVIDPTQAQLAGAITGIMKEVIMPMVVQGEISYAIRALLTDSPAYRELDEAGQRGLAAQSIAAQMMQVQKMMSTPWVRVQARTQQGEDMVLVPDNMFALLVPSFTVMFAFFIVGSMSSELLREKREGSLRRLLASPLPRWTIIAGKMLAFVCLVMVQMLLIFGVANLVFGMPLGSSPAGLLLLTVALGLAATGLGMLVAALARSDRQADSVGVMLGFVLAALGGCFVIGSPVPLYKSGGAIEFIARLTPHAHALMGYDKLLNAGAGVVEVLPQVGVLCGFALVCFLLAAWRFKFE